MWREKDDHEISFLCCETKMVIFKNTDTAFKNLADQIKFSPTLTPTATPTHETIHELFTDVYSVGGLNVVLGISATVNKSHH